MSILEPAPGVRYGDNRFIEPLGHGKQASVWLAEWCPEGEETENAERVAIKVLAPHLRDDEFARMRFQREASVLERDEVWKHPHIVKLIDGPFGIDDEESDADGDADATDAEEELPHIVLDFLGRKTLAEVIKEDRIELDALESRGADKEISDRAEACARDLAPVLQALAVILVYKILHRDVKPHNIIRKTNGGATRLVLVDFGIAKVFDESSNTYFGDRLGSVPYRTEWSTWFAKGNPHWKRALLCGDLYSWGVTLCSWIRAELPAAVTGVNDDGHRIVKGRPKVCDDAVTDARLPEWIRDLCNWCTRINPLEIWTIHEALRHLENNLALGLDIPAEPDLDETDLDTNFERVTHRPTTAPAPETARLGPLPDHPPIEIPDATGKWDGKTWAAFAYAFAATMAASVTTYLVYLKVTA